MQPENETLKTEEWKDYQRYGIDIEDGLQRVGGSWETYITIVSKFYRVFETFPAEIGALINGGHYVNARIQAHSLKGAAANVSCRQISEAAQRLELACNSRDDAEIGLVMPVIQKSLQDLFDALHGLKAGEPVKDNTIMEGRAFEHTDVGFMIKAMEKSLNEADPVTTQNCLNRLGAIMGGMDQISDFDTLFKNLEAKVSGYGFDEALIILEKIAVIFETSVQKPSHDGTKTV